MHPKPSFLVGLIGSGIAASRTPPMHEAAADAAGIRYLYKKIDLTELKLGVETLPELLTAARRMGFDGLNVTHPCKQAILPLLDELSPDAEALGAVNTVVVGNGRMTGHNTDWFGFAENFRRNMQGASLGRVVQFGAGGAGSAGRLRAHEARRAGPDHHGRRLGQGTECSRRIVPPICRTALKGRPGCRSGRSCRRRNCKRDAHRYGQVSRNAAADGPAASESLGRRDRLLPAGNRAAACGACPPLPHRRWWWHGDLPGHRSIPPVHGH